MLSEIAKLPEPNKEKIIKIFYDTLSYELPERKYINTQNISSVSELKYNIERLKENINKLKYEADLKFNEIKELIKDFDYASKKTYEDSYTDLQNNLINDFNNINEIKNYNGLVAFLEKFNKVIDYINNLYKSAYYTKNNKSSLAFLIDDEEEELNLIEKINIEDFKKENKNLNYIKYDI